MMALDVPAPIATAAGIERREMVSPDVDVNKVVLDVVRRAKLEVNVRESILDARVRETIEGAPTFTLTIHDPDLKLLNSNALYYLDADGDRQLRAIDVDVDERTFRLVQLGWANASVGAGADVTLTFEHIVVAYLRQHSSKRKVSRARSTLAEFIKTFAREVKVMNIRFVAPDLHKKQPIEATTKDEAERRSKNDANREPGFADGAKIKVKDVRATKRQMTTIEKVLQAGTKKDVKKKLLVTAIMVITQESRAGVENVSKSGQHHGAFHQDASYGTVKQRMDPTHAANEFFDRAKKVDKVDPTISYSALAERVQKSGDGAPYAAWQKEAKVTVDSFQGSGEATSRTYYKQFNYTRGVDGEKENSWECSQRYAELVGWRSFVVGRASWYFISETRLFKSRPRMRITPTSPAVIGSQGDVDKGKKAQTMTVQVHIKRWTAPPGTVVEVEGWGTADGRWLVQDVERSLFSTEAEIILKRPMKPKPEPRAELTSVETESAETGSLRYRIVREAEKTLTKKTKFNRYSQPGRLTEDPTPPVGCRTDCSQWIRAVYLKAGAKDPGLNTWEQSRKGRRTRKPRPGDLMFTANTGHVELYIGGGRTYGHGSPPIDEASTANFPGHYFVTFDFLDDAPKPKGQKPDKDNSVSAYSKGGGPD